MKCVPVAAPLANGPIIIMKKYTAIYLGTRWTPDYPWGVMGSTDDNPPVLLCVGCSAEQAKEFVDLLNGEPKAASRPAFGLQPSRLALAMVLLAAVLFTGCSIAPLKGGKATTAGAIGQTIAQGDNPAQASRQDQETVKTKTYTVPAGSRMVETRVVADANGVAVTNASAVVISAAMPVVEHEETRAKTELGAAQKDTARELSAKLASLKGIVWVGVAMFLFGLASLFYPPLQAIIGSVTTSAAILAGGLALIVLPTLVIGHEGLILGGVALAVGGWFLAHRYGTLRGLVQAATNSGTKGGA